MSEDAGEFDDDVGDAGPPERCLWCRLEVGCAHHGAGPAGRPVGVVPGRLGGRPVGAVLSEAEERAGLLAEAAPDGDLMGLLLAVDLDEVDDYTAVEVVAAFKRVEAAAAAGAARAAASLARRDSMLGQLRTRRSVREVDLAADELGMRLGVTRQEAGKVVDLGEAFTGVLAPTGEALAAGLIDARKAAMIVTALSGQPGPVAWAVQDEVLPGAGRRTHPQLQRDLNAALIAASPEDARDRERRAARDRKVTRVQPGTDGMAAMTVVAPAHELVVVDATLQAAAVGARAAGDSRSTDQLRADALVALAASALAAGRIGPAPGPSGQVDGFDLSDRVKISLTVPLAVALPADLDLTTCTSVAGEEVLARVPGGGDGPGCSCGQGEKDGSRAPEEPGSAFFRPDPSPVRPDPASAPDPMSAFGDEPSAPVAWLDGVGPVTPEVARALALGGTWRRVVVDPFTETVLDVGRTTYRPPADMARLVRERDGTCVAPGCAVPARSCQLDHSVSWASGGHTAVYNLGPMCEHDHPRKSCGGFSVEQPAPGEFVWTTPSGHRYRRTPDGRVTTLPRKTWEGGEDAPF